MIGFQIIAAIATLFSVVAMSKEKISGWALGLIGLSMFFFIYYHEKLYLQMILQVFFFGQGIYGWITWRKNGSFRRPRWLDLTSCLSQFGIVLVVTFLLSMVYGSYTDASSPFFDTFTTGLCLLGNYWMAKKYIQTWFVWGLVNIILFFLFYSSGLYIVSVIELILFIVSLSSIMAWRKRSS